MILTTAYTKEMAANAVGTQQTWGFIRKPYHIADLIEPAAAARKLPAGKAAIPAMGPD